MPVLIAAEQEDELRAFCNLVEQRRPADGQVAWALARFEMGCERLLPFEALTDYLLALRVLLEPEGTEGARLGDRVAAICAPEEQRAAVSARITRALALERNVIVGAAPSEPGANELVDEIGEHLSALLCDVLCGHLDSDLVGVAEDLLAGRLEDTSAEGESPAVAPGWESDAEAEERAADHVDTPTEEQPVPF
jgi:hypothetical protein